VDREHRVQAALAGTAVPVPRMLCMCSDPVVLGTPFYVMEHVQGTVFVDPSLPSLPAEQRGAVYREIATCLASLHSVNPQAVGLKDFGRPVNYCARQVKRWWGQYLDGLPEGTQPMPEMASLAQHLRSNIPASDSQQSVGCIAHGDFRLDNLVFRTASSLGKEDISLAAVLDWELSTLGDPLADLAYCCQPYYLPSGIAVLPALPRSDGCLLLPPGIPAEEEFVAMYCSLRGIPALPPSLWNFYIALSLFRMAAILAGVQARAMSGNASSSSALELANIGVVKALACCALERCSMDAAPASVSPLPGPLVGAPGSAGFSPTPRVQRLLATLRSFMETRIYPAEKTMWEHAHSSNRWTIHPLMEELKAKSKSQGLWNLWMPADTADLLRRSGLPLPPELLGPGLSNLEYSHLSRVMGACAWASEVFNCSAPDTGNMETLARYGTAEQQRQWLLPLLDGSIRSCFAMTEPAVASSDATNIEASIVRDGAHYLLNGRKWWTSGAMDPRCKVAIFMGKSDPGAPPHAQQSMILVPMDVPGIRIVRPLHVFGYDDAPHGHAEVHFIGVRVPLGNCLLGEGRGFEIAQGRLGPGRLHHCMRCIGTGDRALQAMARRALARKTFGKKLAEHGAFASALAECSVQLEGAKLLVQQAAHELDQQGHKAARGAIAAAKVAAPRASLAALDASIQAHGGGGVSEDFPLAYLWAMVRTLRIADGPDEVHLLTIAKLRLRDASKL